MDKNQTPSRNSDPAGSAPTREDPRQGRRYGVAPMRGKARSRVRYVEGTHPAGGCRFLD